MKVAEKIGEWRRWMRARHTLAKYVGGGLFDAVGCLLLFSGGAVSALDSWNHRQGIGFYFLLASMAALLGAMVGKQAMQRWLDNKRRELIDAMTKALAFDVLEMQKLKSVVEEAVALREDILNGKAPALEGLTHALTELIRTEAVN